MKPSNLNVGDRIRFDLRSPYSEEDIKYGCDSRVQGTTGTIQCIWDVKQTCVVKLDTPLVYDNNKIVYEYWDFAYNMEKISERDKSPINFEVSWKELKGYLNNKRKDYNLQNIVKESSIVNCKIHELDDILEHINQIENPD